VAVNAGELVVVDTTDWMRAAPADPDASAPETDESDASEPALWIGVASFVLAGAALAVGAGMGSAALSSRDDYDASGRWDLDARDRAITQRDASTGLFVTAGVLTAGGLVLVLVAELSPEPSPTVSLVFP
jgi:hypothetical protein